MSSPAPSSNIYKMPANLDQYAIALKGFGADNHMKGLGGNTASQGTLSQWWEQEFYPYYQQVMRGEVTPDPQAWGQVLNSALWAAPQLGIQWPPTGGIFNEGSESGIEGSGDVPAGAKVGINGDLVYNEKSATVQFKDEDRVQHVVSDEFNLNVDSMSAEVRAEMTLDGSVQPPKQVIKITVKDPLLGEEATYLVDPDDAVISIHTPNQKQLTDTTGGKVQWSEAALTLPQSEAGGESSTGLLNENHPSDTQPRKVEKEVATYDDISSTEVTIHSNFDDAVKTHNIVCSGKVTIHAVTASDVVTIEKDGNGNYVITVKKEGSDDSKNWETYHVDASASEIYIGAGKEKIRFVESAQGDPKIKSLIGQEGGLPIPPVLADFIELMNLDSLDALVSLLKSHGFPITSPEDLLDQVQKGQFPPSPDEKNGSLFNSFGAAFVKMLTESDPDLKSAWEEFNQAREHHEAVMADKNHTTSDLVDAAKDRDKAHDAFLQLLAEKLNDLYSKANPPHTIVTGNLDKNRFVIDGKEWAAYEGEDQFSLFLYS